mgnify:CR=1 FL=1|jgi:hypothetical protein
MQLMVISAERFEEEKAYRVYMSDAILTVTETVARAFGGKYMGHRYIDLLEPPKQDETRSGGEIVEDVRSAIAAIGGGDGT